MPAYKQVQSGYLLRGGDAAQMFPGTGLRVNATAAVASTAEAAVPAGAKLIMLRASGPIAIRFGLTGVGAAAVDANSILIGAAGEFPVDIPLHTDGTPFTFFRVIRAGLADAFVQLESVSLAA